jgi:multidrug efflux pump subunit AcrA (membrane-fusion protein)
MSHVGAPMPGVVSTLAVNAGQAVKAGDVLLSIEAMKMETALHAERDGVDRRGAGQGRRPDRRQGSADRLRSTLAGALLLAAVLAVVGLLSAGGAAHAAHCAGA